ncbi:hypothetical protein MHM84_03605 [Halomonas sp. McH1-25]|uniref:hypothetical protein n=1 Tax=unclassified Halomonas TaxID=2609666 RepID=UPI001EF620FB|nr:MULTISPECIES: hypothetical protein [unclassified Halomonas]MCG7598858.1 hypothetical protein [Halomonas sp. McH1-25]MCP1340821.1 hypothetical protein [Halomonas sp. FL8]MCP1361296.1 hypothetical protein [Halomonas sp. BBD45]MCP1364327.1 hypothetical protein [Halomonas sp. BBD48]
MNWSRVHSHRIESGDYAITKNSIADKTLYLVYYREKLIGDELDGNAARRVADKHASKESAKQAIGGEA